MDKISEYVKADDTAEVHDSVFDESWLNDPHLQPVEGGFYQCTLCSATLPGQFHVQMHLQGKMHKRRLGNSGHSCSEAGYLEQYMAQFFDNDIELSFGVIGKNSAPAHSTDKMKCELCDTTLYGWDQWLGHFVGKKHIKARRNCSNRLMWQRLDADFPYYFEHISGLWQSNPPKFGHQLKEGKLVVLPFHPDHNVQ
jgi:hypothetical protein